MSGRGFQPPARLIRVNAVRGRTSHLLRMMDTLSFILASLALLATPGPTNTLLFTSGTAAGLRRSLRLLQAELGGYMIAIVTIMAVLGPVLAVRPGLRLLLQAVAITFLLWTARGLWDRNDTFGADAVTFDKVFFTTLLNPKAFIFASAVIPGDPSAGLLARLPCLALLCLLIAGIGAGWIFAGVAVGNGGARWLSARLCCRAGAIMLAVFAGLLSWSTFASAFSLYERLPH